MADRLYIVCRHEDALGSTRIDHGYPSMGYSEKIDYRGVS